VVDGSAIRAGIIIITIIIIPWVGMGFLYQFLTEKSSIIIISFSNFCFKHISSLKISLQLFLVDYFDCYIRVFDCFIREFRGLFGILSLLGTGFTGKIILQLGVYG